MAADQGWYADWFANGWFPAVWFAPGDESEIPQEQIRPEYAGLGAKTMLPKSRRRSGKELLPDGIIPDTTPDDEEAMILLCL